MRNQKGLWLFYLGLIFLLVGLGALIASFVFQSNGNNDMFKIMGIIVAVSGPLSILMLILKLIFYGGAASPTSRSHSVTVIKTVKTVDVKPVEKSQEEIMYGKYVDLYNRKIITKEDLDKKRVELLGK